ncbi:magnesium/cobalt transporter CorA [Saezia sanguinis]|uniref:magnesium/cobalt transporter CorA n=1 Tax=Saezia sanguinis TaxID=1965230 RepID=UPI00303A7A53
MLNVFSLTNGRLHQEEIEHQEALAQLLPIWVDLEAPTIEEKQWVARKYGVRLPTDLENDDLEESARFFEDEIDGAFHIRCNFLIDDDKQPRNVPVVFILQLSKDGSQPDRLFSIHTEDLPVFRLLRLRARRMPGLIEGAKEVLLELYATEVEYSAEALEGIYDDLDKVSRNVLTSTMSDQLAGEILSTIALEEDLNSRIRRNVMETRRTVGYLMRSRILNAEQFEDARQIMRDIDSLDSHTAFLFEKINFLMDATVGFININQNKIIKIFSVVSVALLPPTLIASIYGMNFDIMPEIHWEYGYPFALGLMILTVAAPFIIFWRKGWLK